jgi:hypothetical protein
MADLRILGAAMILMAGCGHATAQVPDQSVAPQTDARIEILGNYAGRKIKLTVDGRVEWDGYGHLNPSGMSWFIDVKPGEAPVPIELQIDQCETPFKEAVPRDGKTHALIIRGCEIRLSK